MNELDEGAGRLSLHRAGIEDIPDLVRLRRLMFQEMGFTDPSALDRSDRAAADYFRRAIPEGEFHGWLVRIPEGRAVSCGGAVVDRHPPGPFNLSGRIGYIMNLSTEPAFRRRGIAREIMIEILRWFENEGIDVITLHATVIGRSLYEELGFRDSNEMQLTLHGGREE